MKTNKNHNMKSIWLSIFILTTISLSAQTGKFPPYYYQKVSLFEQLPDTQNEIIFLGNSITDGGEWAEMFANPHIKNRGISGDTSEGVLLRLGEVTRSNPAKVFLLIGINDLSQNIPKDSVFAHICQIAWKTRAASPTTTLYLQSILPINESFGRYKKLDGKTAEIIWINAQLETFCQSEGFNFINLFEVMKNKDDQQLNPALTNDGLHLNGDGYMVWMNKIRPLVE